MPRRKKKIRADEDMLAGYDFRHAKCSPVIPLAKNKIKITIRLDERIIKWFKDRVHKQGGGNYQTIINQALSDYILDQENETIEDKLRRVIREEIRAS